MRKEYWIGLGAFILLGCTEEESQNGGEKGVNPATKVAEKAEAPDLEAPASPVLNMGKVQPETEMGNPEATQPQKASQDESTPSVRAFNDANERSQAIMGREPLTQLSKVRHLLLGWRELSPAYRGEMDSRAAARNKETANKRIGELFARVVAGEDFVAMMREESEDPGSAATGKLYTVTPTAGLVPPFKAMGLRLKVGESGIVETIFGWHLMERVE